MEDESIHRLKTADFLTLLPLGCARCFLTDSNVTSCFVMKQKQKRFVSMHNSNTCYR
jgi:hypothetical protein